MPPGNPEKHQERDDSGSKTAEKGQQHLQTGYYNPRRRRDGPRCHQEKTATQPVQQRVQETTRKQPLLRVCKARPHTTELQEPSQQRRRRKAKQTTNPSPTRMAEEKQHSRNQNG